MQGPTNHLIRPLSTGWNAANNLFHSLWSLQVPTNHLLRSLSILQVPANHLLSASVMSAPAALAISKLTYPETEETSVNDDDYAKLEKGWELQTRQWPVRWTWNSGSSSFQFTRRRVLQTSIRLPRSLQTHFRPARSTHMPTSDLYTPSMPTSGFFYSPMHTSYLLDLTCRSFYLERSTIHLSAILTLRHHLDRLWKPISFNKVSNLLLLFLWRIFLSTNFLLRACVCVRV